MLKILRGVNYLQQQQHKYPSVLESLCKIGNVKILFISN